MIEMDEDRVLKLMCFMKKANSKNKVYRGVRYTAAVMLVAVMSLGLSGCGQSGETAPEVSQYAYETGTISLGTGVDGSQIHQAGIAVAGVINNTVPGIHAAVETTKGSMINATNVSEGDLDLAMIAGDVAYDALYGEESFEGKKLENLRVLGACYQEVSGWMALKKSGLTQVNEIKGKIVSSGSKASVTELTSKLVFEVMGIDSSNTEIYSDSLANSVEHIKRETADAVHAFGTLPCYVHEPLAAEYETVVLSYTEEELDKILALDHRYFKTEIPSGTYTGQEEAVPTFGIKMLLCASEDMDPDLAYEIAHALDVNGPTHAGGHRFMSAMLDKEFLCNDLPIPLHEGAERYYREAGLLRE